MTVFVRIQSHQCQVSSSRMEDVIHVSTFKKVTLFLLATKEKEILHGDKPELIRWKGHAGEFKKNTS